MSDDLTPVVSFSNEQAIERRLLTGRQLAARIRDYILAAPDETVLEQVALAGLDACETATMYEAMYRAAITQLHEIHLATVAARERADA